MAGRRVGPPGLRSVDLCEMRTIARNVIQHDPRANRFRHSQLLLIFPA